MGMQRAARDILQVEKNPFCIKNYNLLSVIKVSIELFQKRCLHPN